MPHPIPAVVFSDLHIHNYKAFNDGNNNRLENCLRVLNMVFNYADAKNIDTIIFCGDLYDRQQALPTEVVNETVARLKKLFQKFPRITFYAISGNHDHATRNLLGRPAVTALKHLDDMFERFVLLDYKGVCITDVNGEIAAEVTGLPYFENPEDFDAMIPTPHKYELSNPKRILLCHQTPKGLLPEMVAYDIDPEHYRIQAFDFVLCGHIHKGGRLTDKWLSLCSPLHRDKGDEGQQRGFYTIDLTDPANTVKFISTNPKLPQYLTVDTEEELEQARGAGHYVTLRTITSQFRTEEATAPERFTTDLTPQQLLTNFWEEQGGEDRALLEEGLKLLGI
jgi:DNA repair exonuclease SbcCD nuclease subunit